RGDAVEVARRLGAGSAGHIGDDHGRLAGNEIGKVASDQARIGVIAAACGRADDDAYKFTGEVFVGACAGTQRRPCEDGEEERPDSHYSFSPAFCPPLFAAALLMSFTCCTIAGFFLNDSATT